MLGSSGYLPNIRVAVFLWIEEMAERLSGLASQCASGGHSECTQAGTPICCGAKKEVLRWSKRVAAREGDISISI